MEKTDLENGDQKKSGAKKPGALIAVIVCAALILGITGYDFFISRSSSESTTIAMGTVIKLKLSGSDSAESIETVKENIEETEKSLLSRNVAYSDIGRINSSAGLAVYVSQETADFISQALEVSSYCPGFDVTVGRISKLWNFDGESQSVPSDDEIKALLTSVGFNRVKVSGNSVTIGKDQALDLGAIGKGAACDRIRNVLKGTKTKSAVISVGGSLLLYGKKKYSIGIVNPLNDKEYMATLRLSDTCVSTSGNYEKSFEKGGVTYHHILDARTGYPVRSKLSGVTVICDSGAVSDALSTACYILDYNGSSELLKKYDAEAVFVYSDKSVRITDGIKDRFEITDDSYKVV